MRNGFALTAFAAWRVDIRATGNFLYENARYSSTLKKKFPKIPAS